MAQVKTKRKVVKKKKRLKPLPVIILLLVIVILIGGGIGLFGYSKAQKPVSKSEDIVYFNVEQGTSANAIIQQLEDEGIISNAFYASIYAKLNDLTSFCAGSFTIDKANDLKTILTILNDPSKAQTDTVSVTVIEGDWVKHIANRIASGTVLEEQELLSAWNDRSYIETLMADYSVLTPDIFNENSRYLLEGYLFPDTYEFFVDTSVDEVTRKLLDNTQAVYESLVNLKPDNLSVHQWFTLSSIVQYEASKVDDMKLVASVFFNRLAIGMPLQSSVTVCYALDVEKDGNWQQCEYNPNYDSPYNTYMINGLPPGPILNPGKDALEAVVQPADSEYYYFMADVYGDGSVYYSKTLSEHEALVNKYLR